MKSQPVESAARGRAAFLKLVTHHVDELSEFVRRELARHEALGDLLRGETTPHDVVDAVLLRAQRDFAKQPRPSALSRKRLIQLATDHLDAQIRRSKSERAHAVRDIPETPSAEATSTPPGAGRRRP
jgi:DNA-directed RNA polymerase specialized sigma24 family protein